MDKIRPRSYELFIGTLGISEVRKRELVAIMRRCQRGAEGGAGSRAQQGGGDCQEAGRESRPNMYECITMSRACEGAVVNSSHCLRGYTPAQSQHQYQLSQVALRSLTMHSQPPTQPQQQPIPRTCLKYIQLCRKLHRQDHVANREQVAAIMGLIGRMIASACPYNQGYAWCHLKVRFTLLRVELLTQKLAPSQDGKAPQLSRNQAQLLRRLPLICRQLLKSPHSQFLQQDYYSYIEVLLFHSLRSHLLHPAALGQAQETVRLSLQIIDRQLESLCGVLGVTQDKKVVAVLGNKCGTLLGVYGVELAMACLDGARLQQCRQGIWPKYQSILKRVPNYIPSQEIESVVMEVFRDTQGQYAMNQSHFSAFRGEDGDGSVDAGQNSDKDMDMDQFLRGIIPQQCNDHAGSSEKNARTIKKIKTIEQLSQNQQSLSFTTNSINSNSKNMQQSHMRVNNNTPVFQRIKSPSALPKQPTLHARYLNKVPSPLSSSQIPTIDLSIARPEKKKVTIRQSLNIGEYVEKLVLCAPKPTLKISGSSTLQRSTPQKQQAEGTAVKQPAARGIVELEKQNKVIVVPACQEGTGYDESISSIKLQQESQVHRNETRVGNFSSKMNIFRMANLHKKKSYSLDAGKRAKDTELEHKLGSRLGRELKQRSTSLKSIPRNRQPPARPMSGMLIPALMAPQHRPLRLCPTIP